MYVVAIKNCSACGNNHLGMPTYTLDTPVMINRVSYYTYAICPKTNTQIYVEREEKVVAERGSG